MTSAHRTRTPPEVKWLANELAATAGEIEKVDVELGKLLEHKAKLQRVHAALSEVAASLSVPDLPEIVPVVKTHRNLGGRGALRNFVRNALKRAYPKALDTLTIAEAMATHFQVNFANAEARSHFRRYSVVSTLQRLLERGEVERLPSLPKMVNAAGIWRWKVDAPTFDELKVRIAATHVNGEES